MGHFSKLRKNEKWEKWKEDKKSNQIQWKISIEWFINGISMQGSNEKCRSIWFETIHFHRETTFNTKNTEIDSRESMQMHEHI